MIVLHPRVPEERLKESQKRVQEKEQSRDREKSREKKLLPKGVQNHHIPTLLTVLSVYGVSKKKPCPSEKSRLCEFFGYLNSDESHRCSLIIKESNGLIFL